MVKGATRTALGRRRAGAWPGAGGERLAQRLLFSVTLNVPLAPFEVLVTLAFALSLPLEASALGHRVGAPAEPLGLGRVHGATAREPAEEADLAHAIRTTGCSSTDLAEMPS